MELTKEQKFYARIVQEAHNNPEFKKEFRVNPVAAIEKLTGRNINLLEK